MLHKASRFGFLVVLMSFFSFSFVSASEGIDFLSTPLAFNYFIIISAIMLFLLVFGLVARMPTFLLLGFLLLFIIGGYVEAENILVPNGNVYSVYGNNFSDYHWDGHNGTSEAPSQSDREAFLFNTQKEYEVMIFPQAHIIGLFLMVMSAFAMIFSIFIGVGGKGNF